MPFTSTRNGKDTVSFCEAAQAALAPDGGLYCPTEFPPLPEATDDYGSTAAEVLGAYIPELEEPLRRTVTENYRSFPIPLVKTDCGNFLELFHGPSGAFKDVALTLLPKLAQLCGMPELLYVTATSGDTGKAALASFSDVPNTRLMVFYPEEGVAPLQKLQMQTQAGDNLRVVAVRGNFDDAQRVVKEILHEDGEGISSCNSINVARLLSQIPYYLHAAKQWGRPISRFIVPTGNFGDILAGYYAHRSGLPVEKLIVATNANNVLEDFFRTGVYDRRRTLKKTNSPSMDILVSSNLERLLFHVFGAERTAQWMRDLQERGVFEVPAEELSLFSAHSASEEEIGEAIATVYNETGYIMDPHTACAWVAWDKEGRPDDTILLATASPSKFPESIVEALTGRRPSPKEALDLLAQRTALHPALTGLFDLPIRFEESVDPADARAAFEAFRKGES